MATVDCKRCGGVLEIIGKGSIAKCKYCGSQQTIPRLLDDKILALYERAGHLRRNSEYDRALEIYENILNETPDDAEAYWSIILCRYGLVYVEDPKTKRRLPTITRIQNTSLLADEDYKAALKYADSEQKKLYEEEAREIERIRERFLTISREEKPYDVFICYKDKDEKGHATEDSVIAMEIYNRLHREGLNVFFAHITLDDKLGHEYEPYIFAALNSAKVMIVLGTRPEYFTAPWLKNEWSRFISLIKAGEKKTLISAFKNMDGGDLPDELKLQAQDMTKMGFLENLVYVTNREIERNGGMKKEAPPAHEFRTVGEQYQQTANHYTPQPPVKKKKKGGIVAVLVALLLVGAIGIGALSAMRDGIGGTDPAPDQNQEHNDSGNPDVTDDYNDSATSDGYGDPGNSDDHSNSDDPGNSETPGVGSILTYDDISYEIMENGVKVIGYRGTATHLEIPSNIEDYEVLAINSEAFKNCTILRTVTVPSGVKTIEAGAFSGCTSLTELVIPFVGRSASEASSANAVLGYIFSAPQSTGKSTYQTSGNEGLTTQGMDDSARAYAIPSSLRKVTVTSQSVLPAYAFQNCDTLREIHIETPLSRVGEYAFDRCSLLSTLTFGTEQFVTVERYAFRRCTSLTTLTVPEGVTELGEGAFAYCTALEELWLPEGLEKISKEAFISCSALTSITIPNSVKNMQLPLFENCSRLERITVPFIGSQVNTSSVFGALFSSAESKSDATTTDSTSGYTSQSLNQGPTIDRAHYASYKIPKSLREVTVTLQTAVPDFAFMNCDLLKNVTYEKTLSSIGSYAFSGCANVEYFAGTLGSDSQIGDHAFAYCASIVECNIPEGVTRIGTNAFARCSSIEAVTIPSTVKSVGNGAFSGCTALYTLMINPGVTSIGSMAFYDCTALTEVHLPSSIKTMDYGIFQGCTSLTSLIVPFIGSSASSDATLGFFFGNPGSYSSTVNKTSDASEYTSQQPHNGSTYYYVHYPIPKNLRHVLVTEQDHIPDYAFKNCDLLTEIGFAKKLTSVGSYAFQNCTELSAIYYSGSMADYQTVSFGTGWNSGAAPFEVVCDYDFGA